MLLEFLPSKNYFLENYKQYFRKHILSKTTFVKAKQCTKMLYLSKFKQEEKKAFSKQTEVLFAFGRHFEEDFRKKFKDSIHLNHLIGNQFHLYAGLTEELLSNNERKTLFEAGFVYDEVLVLTDVLQQNENNTFTIYEIKNTQKLKPVILWDLALQYYVCKNKLKNIESFNVVLKGKKDKYKIFNVTNLLEKYMTDIKQEISNFKEILELKKEPKIQIGKQCFRPYECQFMEYCRK